MPIGEADLFEQGHRMVFCLRGFFLEHLHRPLDDVFQNGSMRQQIEALEYHSHLAANAGIICYRDRMPQNVDFAAVMTLQAVDAAQHGRLSGPRRTDKTSHLPLWDREADVPENVVRTKMLGHLREADHARAIRRSNRRTRAARGRLAARYSRATNR